MAVGAVAKLLEGSRGRTEAVGVGVTVIPEGGYIIPFQHRPARPQDVHHSTGHGGCRPQDQQAYRGTQPIPALHTSGVCHPKALPAVGPGRSWRSVHFSSGTWSQPGRKQQQRMLHRGVPAPRNALEHPVGKGHPLGPLQIVHHGLCWAACCNFQMVAVTCWWAVDGYNHGSIPRCGTQSPPPPPPK